MIYGNAKAIEPLYGYLPVSTLLFGFEGVGKRALTEELAIHHKVKPYEHVRFDRLNMAAAREILEICQSFPTGPFRLISANLDWASSGSLNSLLKLVEEPPPKTRLLFRASRSVLPTIMSRCTIVRLGFLSVEEVEQVLTEVCGWSPERASEAARRSGGTVAGAMQAEARSVARGPVLSLLKAVAQSDADLMVNVLEGYGPKEHEMLEQWWLEARSGVWSFFTPQESFGLQNDSRTLKRIESALASGARPKIAARAALMASLERK